MAAGKTYSLTEVAQLINSVGKSHNDQPSAGMLVILTSIVMAESRGNSGQVGIDPNDRGLWQWNRKAHPDISDADAFDPVKSTEWVYQKTNGWKIDKVVAIWVNSAGQKSHGLDAQNLKDTAAALNVNWADVTGAVAGNAGGVATEVGGNVVSAIASPFTALSDAVLGFIKKITSIEFWKRIGIFAVGLWIAVAAIVIVFKDDIAKAGKAAGETAVLV